MNRFFGWGGASFWIIGAYAVFVAGVSLAVEPKDRNTSQASGGYRFANPSASIGNPLVAAPGNTAAPAASAQPISGYHPSYPYGYGNGSYSTYGYAPYGYYPPGTLPYGTGYPSSGSTSLNPSAGGTAAYGSPYPYYRYPTLGAETSWGQPQGAAADAANGNLYRSLVIGNGNRVNPGLTNSSGSGQIGPGMGGGQFYPGKAAAVKPVIAAGGTGADLARRFISDGDAAFRNQRYNDALDRYRSAAQESPTLGDAWFREGFAFTALGNYDQAATAIRRGLAEQPSGADATFHLGDLYGSAGAQKQAILDKMTKASDAQPGNGDLAVLAGLHLYLDGKAVQAAPYLRRAARLATDAGVKSYLAKWQ
jgi:hypothetical protein